MKNFFTILIFLVISNVSLAEIIKDIKINGNERISDETVKVYGDIQINQNDIKSANGISIDAYSWINSATPGLLITKNDITGSGVGNLWGSWG